MTIHQASREKPQKRLDHYRRCLRAVDVDRRFATRIAAPIVDEMTRRVDVAGQVFRHLLLRRNESLRLDGSRLRALAERVQLPLAQIHTALDDLESAGLADVWSAAGRPVLVALTPEVTATVEAWEGDR